MMLKKLIPAAALLALAGAAQAQVTIYGLVDVGLAKTTADDLAKTDPSVKFGGNSTTRVGLKGSKKKRTKLDRQRVLLFSYFLIKWKV